MKPSYWNLFESDITQELDSTFAYERKDKYPAISEKIDEPSFRCGLEGLFIDAPDTLDVLGLLSADYDIAGPSFLSV